MLIQLIHPGRKSSTPEVPDNKLMVKERKVPRSSQMNRSLKKSLSKPAQVKDQDDEEDVYGGLNASLTVIMHGIESDWIEEEMSDDDEFRFRQEPLQYKYKFLL